MAALQFAFVFVLMASGAVLFLLIGAGSLYFHWRDLQHVRHHPPMDRQVLERHMQQPVSRSPEEARIRKLQKDYEQMAKFRQSTLIGAMGFDVLMLALGAFAFSQARPAKIREMCQTRRGESSRKGPNFVQQDPRPKWARLSLFIGSAVVLAGCVFLLIHFRTELARVQDSPPLKYSTLKFYMPPLTPGSPEVQIARKLHEDYADMENSHERHLKATLYVLLIPASVCGFVMLFQIIWLWPRKPQPQPPIDITPDQPSPGISQPGR